MKRTLLALTLAAALLLALGCETTATLPPPEIACKADTTCHPAP